MPFKVAAVTIVSHFRSSRKSAWGSKLVWTVMTPSGARVTSIDGPAMLTGRAGAAHRGLRNVGKGLRLDLAAVGGQDFARPSIGFEGACPPGSIRARVHDIERLGYARMAVGSRGWSTAATGRCRWRPRERRSPVRPTTNALQVSAIAGAKAPSPPAWLVRRPVPAGLSPEAGCERETPPRRR